MRSETLNETEIALRRFLTVETLSIEILVVSNDAMGAEVHYSAKVRGSFINYVCKKINIFDPLSM